MIVLNLTPTKFSYGKIEFVETLLSRGADQRVANIHQQLPIHLACYGGQFSLLNVFLATSTGRESLETREKDGNFCLHLAATVEGNTRMLKRLAALSNINNSNHNGETCLIIAAKMSHLRNLKTIIGQGANVRLTDSRGRTALHAAAAKGHTRIIEYLMAEAPEISNEVTSAGETALSWHL